MSKRFELRPNQFRRMPEKLQRQAVRASNGLKGLLGRLWRRQNIGLLVRAIVTVFLITYSWPPLREIFEPRNDWYGVGALFETAADCGVEFHLDNHMEVNEDGIASGTVKVAWTGDDSQCNRMRFFVPGVIELVKSFKKSTGGAQNELTPIFPAQPDQSIANKVTIDGSGQITIDLAALDMNVRQIDEPALHGDIEINFDDAKNFIRPVNYTRSVTNIFVRSLRLPKPGDPSPTSFKSIEEFARYYRPMPSPIITSSEIFPARFAVSTALVANPLARARDRGASEVSWNGEGLIYLDDMDHAERKDLVILIYGILLATGLAMLAELVCKCAEAIAAPLAVENE